MARIPMQVVGPFRDAAIGDTVKVSLKDSRTFADSLKPVKVTAKKAPAKKAAKKAATKKAGSYKTRAMKAR